VNKIADALTLITNIPGVLLWIGLDYMLEMIDLASVIFLQCIITTFYLIICTVCFDSEIEFFSLEDNGIFGFFRKDNLYITFFWGSFISMFWAFCGYVIGM
jgi:hypothetical protein